MMKNIYKKQQFKFLFLTIILMLNVLFIQANGSNSIKIDNTKHELIAPEGENYQWYINGNPIEGAKSKNINPSQSGEFSVVYSNSENEVSEESITVQVKEDEIINIFIIGDSTVSSYGSSQYPFTGWGQILHHFFDASLVTINNKARGGRSSRSFYEEGLWASVLTELDSGNYVFIQFGHNDRDASNDSRYTSPENFITYLTIYVNESRAKGAIPVLVSPMSMNTGTRNVFTESGSDYRGAMLKVAEDLDVPFLDLNTKSYDYYQEIGMDYAKYFVHMGLAPGEYANYPDGYSDYWTHYQEMGALAMARMITEEINDKKSNVELAPLAALLKPLYNVTISLNKPDAGVSTISGDYPEGATVTLKAMLKGNDILKYWVDSTNSITLDKSIGIFTMAAHDYKFTGMVTDCFGIVDGNAIIDNCGVCSGGETGLDPCAESIYFSDFCETNANIKLEFGDELYSLKTSIEGVENPYFIQPISVASSDTFLFAITYNNSVVGESLNILVDDVLQVSEMALNEDGVSSVLEFSLYLEAGERNLKFETTAESGTASFDNLALFSSELEKGACKGSVEPSTDYFGQADSIIVIEAENYTKLVADENGDNWVSVLMDDASSDKVLIAPDGGTYTTANEAELKAAIVKYKVVFPHTGSYSIWARVYAFNASSDSYHVGLNDKVLIEKIDLYNSTNIHEAFTWMHVADKKLTVSKTGEILLSIFGREPNLIIDKIILSMNSAYIPEGFGPDQTLNVGGDITGVYLLEGEKDLKLNVYPNPALNKLNIEYLLNESGQVDVSLLNVIGQKVADVISENQQMGNKKITWNLDKELSNGIYFISVKTANSLQHKKVVIGR